MAPNSEDGYEGSVILCLAYSKYSILLLGGEKVGKMNTTACNKEMLKRNTNYQ